MFEALLLVLVGLSAGSAYAAMCYRLPVESLPAVVLMGLALLSLPVWTFWSPEPVWALGLSMSAGAVSLVSALWAWQTRGAQLRPGWWRQLRIALPENEEDALVDED